MARQAGDRGWHVVGSYLTREPPAGEAIRLDVTDAAAVERAVERVRPDRIIHTAYRQDERAATVDGAANVAAAAARTRTRLVHVSSDVVFGGRLGRPYREGDRPDPITDYGRAKLDAEHAVAERAPAAAIARTSLLLAGPERSRHEIARTSLLLAGPERSRHEIAAIAAAEGCAEYPFYTDELRNPLAVSDAATALIELAHLAVSGVLHVAGPDAVSRYDLACLIAASAGLPADRIPFADGAAAAGRPADCRLDTSWARSLLGSRIRGIRTVFAPE